MKQPPGVHIFHTVPHTPEAVTTQFCPAVSVLRADIVTVKVSIIHRSYVVLVVVETRKSTQEISATAEHALGVLIRIKANLQWRIYPSLY